MFIIIQLLEVSITMRDLKRYKLNNKRSYFCFSFYFRRITQVEFFLFTTILYIFWFVTTFPFWKKFCKNRIQVTRWEELTYMYRWHPRRMPLGSSNSFCPHEKNYRTQWHSSQARSIVTKSKDNEESVQWRCTRVSKSFLLFRIIMPIGIFVKRLYRCTICKIFTMRGH